MSTGEKVVYEKHGDVAALYFNDPATLNALSQELCEEFAEKLDRAASGSRAIILSGRGRGFSSGASLTGEAFNPGDEIDLGKELDTVFNPIIRQLRDLPVPLITAVGGPAAGVGCSIALMGDIIVASKSAYFLQAFCNIALVPDGGSPYLLARSIGRVRAMEMMLLGEKYPAARAFEEGLVTRLVEDDALDETAMALATRLAAGPTRTYGMIRKAAWAALDNSLEEQLALERALQRDAGRTRDFVEGVSAFMAKRAAKFTGE